eukprot:101892-Prorocentrum_minimum.AAC.1
MTTTWFDILGHRHLRHIHQFDQAPTTLAQVEARAGVDGVEQLFLQRLPVRVGRQLEQVHAGGGGGKAGVVRAVVRRVGPPHPGPVHAEPGLQVPEPQQGGARARGHEPQERRL